MYWNAQALATRVRREVTANEEKKLEHLYRLCLARLPSAPERERLLRFFQEQRTAFEHSTEAARELAGANAVGTKPAEAAAWTAVASVLLNLDEFITRE